MNPEDVARTIRPSRQDFARVFLLAQLDAAVTPRTAFDAVATSGDDREAIRQAVEYAELKGWAKFLLAAIWDAGIHTPEFVRLLEAAFPDEVQLQAVVREADGFPNPDLCINGVRDGMRWTAQIMVNGRSAGTGVLVGANLVLTAWHVVCPLFDRSGSTGFRPAAGSAQKLKVVFDDCMIDTGVARARRQPLSFDVHDDWCLVSSPCHDDELHHRLPQPLSGLDGCWDYAIIRLRGVPGTERSWARFDQRSVVPRDDAEIVVFHHPDGQPLKSNPGRIMRPHSALSAVVPGVRFLHLASTTPASSGGPCFDRTFTLFGIHQGAWRHNGATTPENAAGASGTLGVRGGNRDAVAPTLVNCGVPIQCVHEHLSRQIGTLPPPSVSELPVTRIRSAGSEPERPVIGRDALVESLWEGAMGGWTALVIEGEPHAGKSFCLDVMAEVLPVAGHQRLELYAPEELPRDAAGLTASLCVGAGAELPDLASPGAVASTRAAWLRDEVLPKTLAALEQARQGRMLWLSFRDMNKNQVFGEDTSDFLLALYERAPKLDWLRLVLDGLPGDLPFALRQRRVFVAASWPDAAALQRYLKRTFTEARRRVDDSTVAVFAGQAESELQGYRRDDPNTAMARLALRVTELVALVLKCFPEHGDGR